MGYRSIVIIGVKEGKLSNEFDKILKKHEYNPTKSNEWLKIGEKDGMKTYIFDYVKWYSSDDWIKEIEEFIEKIVGDVALPDSAFLIGMGEEGEIHTEYGNHWGYVDIIRDLKLRENQN